MNTKEFERLVKLAGIGEAVVKLVTEGKPKRGRPFGSTKQAANGEAKPKRKRGPRKAKAGVTIASPALPVEDDGGAEADRFSDSPGN